MRILTVALPEEFDELADEISKISVEKKQSISRTIREMLCEVTKIEPTRSDEVKKRNMYCEKTKSKVRRVTKKI